MGIKKQCMYKYTNREHRKSSREPEAGSLKKVELCWDLQDELEGRPGIGDSM